MRLPGSKRAKLILAALVAGLAVIPAAVMASWGPARPTFTWANPANYITFNSITDNPVVGDERPFLAGRLTTSSGLVDSIKVKDKDEVLLRVYFHNNAKAELNLVAQNTRVKIFLPRVESSQTFATSMISADNATPKVVSDTVEFKGDKAFTLEYIPGSAQLFNNKFNGAKLSDDIVTNTGALVGFDNINGKVPGCEQFSGYVHIKVKVKVKEQPKPQPEFKCDALNVTVRDNRRVDASVAFTAKNGATLSTIKYDFGDGSTPLVTNNTSVSYQYAKDGDYTISATLTFNVGDTQKTAVCTKKITVKTEVPKPVFRCDNLTVTTSANRNVNASVAVTATNGATLNNVEFNWGDSSTPTVTNSTSASHQYSKDGSYTISATPSFKLPDGSIAKPNAVAACQKTIVFHGDVPPTVTTPPTPVAAGKPTTLPNAGPGSVISLFTGVSAAAAGAHYIVSARRNRF